MTNEEALGILHCPDTVGGLYSEKYGEALGMAMEALKREPCEDYISRQAVLDGLASIAKVKAKSDAQKSLIGRVMFFTEHLPSVTPQSKTGRWMECGGDEPWLKGYCCSLCNFTTTQKYDYCTCGAKMVELQESEVEE